MTDKEWRAQIKSETNQALLEHLVYYGTDMYYYSNWKATLKEIARRLSDVKIEELGIG